MAYTSKYTGAQIDKAVGAFLTNGVRTSTKISITKDSWEGTNAPYQITISASGNVTLGSYPDVFIVDSDDRSKMIPEIVYSTDGKSFTIKSNKNISGTIVIYGAMDALDYTVSEDVSEASI